MANNNNITLSVKRSTFRIDDPHTEIADNAFTQARAAVLRRDRNTCRFCGFKATKFQEVHHIDDDHSNNDPKNLITVCALCHACHHISFAGAHNQGLIIHIPPKANIDQATLNATARALWLAEHSKDTNLRAIAESFSARLYKCIIPAKKLIGTSSAEVLGNYLSKLSDDEYSRRSNVFHEYGIYLLPKKEGFEKQFNHWASEAKKFPSEKWVKETERMLSQWADNEFDTDQIDNTIASYIKTKDKDTQ
ncbi:type IVB secretion system protein IcmJDotN [Vibrio breoganii]